MATVAATMEALVGLVVRSLTKDRSILTRSMGSRDRWASDEWPVPKSSSDRLSPRALSWPTISVTRATFRITVLSVSSSSSRCGSIPLAPSSRSIRPGSAGLWKWLAARLTATLTSGTPARCQVSSWAITSASTHSPMATMRPVSSAMGMNTPGGTRPMPGRFQRTSASRPTISPETRLTCGW